MATERRLRRRPADVVEMQKAATHGTPTGGTASGADLAAMQIRIIDAVQAGIDELIARFPRC